MGDKANQLAQEMSRFEQELLNTAPTNNGPRPLFSNVGTPLLQRGTPPGPPPGNPPMRPPRPLIPPPPPPGVLPRPPPGLPPGMSQRPPPGLSPGVSQRPPPPPGMSQRPIPPGQGRPPPPMQVPPQHMPQFHASPMVPQMLQPSPAPIMMPLPVQSSRLPVAEATAINTETIQPPKPLKQLKMKRDPKKLRMGGGKVWADPSLDDWDQDDFRIFVGDLGNDVNDDALARSFSKYSSFLKAKVIRDKYTKKTKGFGFVSFKTPQDFMQAMKEMNGKYIGNRPIKLRKSTWKDCCYEVVKKKEKEKKRLGFR